MSQSYGTAIPTFSGSVTGFVLSQNQATATNGTLSFNTAATQASNVAPMPSTAPGRQPITTTTSFVQAAGNATALTIMPATLTYTANAVNQSYGTAIRPPAGR